MKALEGSRLVLFCTAAVPAHPEDLTRPAKMFFQCRRSHQILFEPFVLIKRVLNDYHVIRSTEGLGSGTRVPG